MNCAVTCQQVGHIVGVGGYLAFTIDKETMIGICIQVKHSTTVPSLSQSVYFYAIKPRKNYLISYNLQIKTKSSKTKTIKHN